MAEQQYDIEKIRSLRAITKAVSEVLYNQIKEYMSTLMPLFRPSVVLGEYVDSSSRTAVKGADRAFNELKRLYESLAGSKPFDLSSELRQPIEIMSTTPELRPMEYSYLARNEGQSKTIQITSPLRWSMCYSGFGRRRLIDLSEHRAQAASDLSQFLLHTLLMHAVVSGQTGLRGILEALHFPVSFERVEGLGDLPVTVVSAAVSTVRPPDSVIFESTFISGTDAFEEVLRVEDIVEMRDPLKSRLLDIMDAHGLIARRVDLSL